MPAGLHGHSNRVRNAVQGSGRHPTVFRGELVQVSALTCHAIHTASTYISSVSMALSYKIYCEYPYQQCVDVSAHQHISTSAVQALGTEDAQGPEERADAWEKDTQRVPIATAIIITLPSPSYHPTIILIPPPHNPCTTPTITLVSP